MQEKIEQLTDMIFNAYPKVRKAFRNLVSIKDLPISMTQLTCLYNVDQCGTVIMSQLAKQLDMSNQQLTKVVDVLVGFDMVKRTVDPHNRRRLIVETTEKGKNTLKSLYTEVSKKLAVFLNKDKSLAEDIFTNLGNLYACLQRLEK